MNIHTSKMDNKTQLSPALHDRASELQYLILETIKATTEFAKSLLSEGEEASKLALLLLK